MDTSKASRGIVRQSMFRLPALVTLIVYRSIISVLTSFLLLFDSEHLSKNS